MIPVCVAARIAVYGDTLTIASIVSQAPIKRLYLGHNVSTTAPMNPVVIIGR
jgi:hypothetical protein